MCLNAFYIYLGRITKYVFFQTVRNGKFDEWIGKFRHAVQMRLLARTWSTRTLSTWPCSLRFDKCTPAKKYVLGMLACVYVCVLVWVSLGFFATLPCFAAGVQAKLEKTGKPLLSPTSVPANNSILSQHMTLSPSSEVHAETEFVPANYVSDENGAPELQDDGRNVNTSVASAETVTIPSPTKSAKSFVNVSNSSGSNVEFSLAILPADVQKNAGFSSLRKQVLRMLFDKAVEPASGLASAPQISKVLTKWVEEQAQASKTPDLFPSTLSQGIADCAFPPVSRSTFESVFSDFVGNDGKIAHMSGYFAKCASAFQEERGVLHAAKQKLQQHLHTQSSRVDELQHLLEAKKKQWRRSQSFAVLEAQDNMECVEGQVDEVQTQLRNERRKGSLKVREINGLKSENDRLRSAITDLQDEFDRRSSNLLQVQAEKDLVQTGSQVMQRDQERLFEQYAELQSVTQQQQRRLDEILREKTLLEEVNADLEKCHSDQTLQIAQLQDEQTALQQSAIANRQDIFDENEELNKTVDQLRNQLERSIRTSHIQERSVQGSFANGTFDESIFQDSMTGNGNTENTLAAQQVKKLAADLQSARGKIVELEAERSTSTASLEEQQERTKRDLQASAKVQAQLDEAISSIKAKEEAVNTLTKQVTDLVSQLGEANERLSADKSSIASASKNIAELEDTLRCNIATDQKETQHQKQVAAGLQAQLDDAARAIKEKDEAIDSLNKMLGDLTSQLDAVNDRHRADESSIDFESNRAAELEDQMRQNLETQKKELQQQAFAAAEVQAQLDAANSLMQQQKQVNTDVQAQFEKAAALLQAKDEAVEGMNKIVNNLTAELDLVNDRHRADESTIGFTANRVAEVEDQMSRTIEKHQNEIQQHTQITAQVHEQLCDAVARIQQQKQTTVDVQQQLDEATCAIKQKDEAVSGLNKMLKTLNLQLDAVNERQRADKSGTDLTSNRVVELEDQIARNTEMYTTLEEQHSDLNRRCASVEVRNSKLDIRNNLLETQKADIMSKCASLETANVQLTAKGGTYQIDNTELAAKCGRLGTQNIELTTNCSNLEMDNTELSEQCASLGTHKRELERQLAKVQGKLEQSEEHHATREQLRRPQQLDTKKIFTCIRDRITKVLGDNGEGDNLTHSILNDSVTDNTIEKQLSIVDVLLWRYKETANAEVHTAVQLQAQLDEGANLIKEKDIAISGLNKVVRTLTSQLDAVNANHGAVESGAHVSANEATALHADLEVQHVHMEEQKQGAAKVQARLDEATRLHTEKDTTINGLNQILNHLTLQLDAVNEKLHANQSDYAEPAGHRVVAELEDYAAVNASLVKEKDIAINGLNKILTELTAELDVVNDQHHADESCIKSSNHRLVQVEVQLQEAMGLVKEKDEAIGALNDILVRLNAELDAVNERHHADESGIDFHANRVAELEDQVDRNIEMYTTLEQHNNELNKRCTSTERHNTDLQELAQKMEYDLQNEKHQRSVEHQQTLEQQDARKTVLHLSQKITRALGCVDESYSSESVTDSASYDAMSAIETQVNTLLARCQIAEEQVCAFACE